MLLKPLPKLRRQKRLLLLRLARESKERHREAHKCAVFAGLALTTSTSQYAAGAAQAAPTSSIG
jgi:hypothetical protein